MTMNGGTIVRRFTCHRLAPLTYPSPPEETQAFRRSAQSCRRRLLADSFRENHALIDALRPSVPMHINEPLKVSDRR